MEEALGGAADAPRVLGSVEEFLRSVRCSQQGRLSAVQLAAMAGLARAHVHEGPRDVEPLRRGLGAPARNLTRLLSC